MSADIKLDTLCQQVKNMLQSKQKQDDALKAMLDRLEWLEYNTKEVKK